MTRPRKHPGASGIRTRDLPLSNRTPQPLGQRGGGVCLGGWGGGGGGEAIFLSTSAKHYSLVSDVHTAHCHIHRPRHPSGCDASLQPHRLLLGVSPSLRRPLQLVANRAACRLPHGREHHGLHQPRSGHAAHLQTLYWVRRGKDNCGCRASHSQRWVAAPCGGHLGLAVFRRGDPDEQILKERRCSLSGSDRGERV